MAKKLEINNPLANNVLFKEPTVEETKAATEATPKKKGRPLKDEIVRDNSKQEGLTAEYTRASFILSVENVDFIKDYAYTKRITIKDALDEIIGNFKANYEADKTNEPILKHK